MSFTVEDFHDLIELLAQHPEWRAELRRHVLSDDLIELPAVVLQLAEAQARTETRLRELAEAQTRTEVRLRELAEAQARTETRLTGVETRLTGVETRLTGVEGRLGRVEDQVGNLDGEVLEVRYILRGPAYFGRIARGLRVIEPGPLSDMLDDAVDDGLLTMPERESIMLADLVLSGRRRDSGQDVYLLVEVSGGIGPYDVERAVERAALLEKLGRTVFPVVAGRRGDPETAALAYAQGVWVVVGGRVTPPRSA